jgi:hypothetical protein
MSFTINWQTGTNTDGFTQHTFYVAPLQIGGIVIEKPYISPVTREAASVYAYLGSDWKMARGMDDVPAAKKWIEDAWLPVLKRNAPHFLPK